MLHVGIELHDPDWRHKAAHLLGKSERMVAYYREGRPIPRDVLLLMDAIAEGYTPRPWSASRERAAS